MHFLLRWLSRRPLRLLHGMGAVLGWRPTGLAQLPPAPARQRRAGRRGTAERRAPWPRPASWCWSCRGCGCARRAAHRRPGALGRRRALIDAAAGRGRGLVLLTPHMGSFEVAAQAYAERFGARQPDHRAVPAGAPGLAARAGGPPAPAPALATAPANLAGVRQMMRALKRGETWACCPTRCRPRAWACGRPSSASRPTR
jgi:Kdo2-lipid IVA lauroyltransferase/acyltransferase